jgi:hypothetical protein
MIIFAGKLFFVKVPGNGQKYFYHKATLRMIECCNPWVMQDQ